MGTNLERMLVGLAQNPVLSGPIFAILSTFAVVFAKRLHRRQQQRTPEDFAVGIDLLAAAVGIQLAALPGVASVSSLTKSKANTTIACTMLGLLCLVLFLSMIFIRLWGYEDDRATLKPRAIVLPSALGILVLFAVYMLNAALVVL
jgi:uncharacterized membrane protein